MTPHLHTILALAPSGPTGLPTFRFLQPEYLHALWAVPAVALLLLYARSVTARALRAFAEPSLLDQLLPPASLSRSIVRAALVLLALSAIALALARPGYKPVPREVTRAGRDVVFIVDTSRSMLAQDLKPNRLERAKLMLRDVLDTARGDRVAIVAFAGSSVVKCPLTTDYAFARLALDDLSTESVLRGGTLIGDAIRTALDLFFKPDQPPDTRHRDIILITDGEDHESFPLDAARQAGQRNVRIIALGLGSPDTGSPIPISSDSGNTEYLEYEGQAVRSRLNPELLRQIADASHQGVSLNVATANIQLDRIYRQIVQNADRQAIKTAETLRYQEAFPYLLIAAIILLVIESLTPTRTRPAVNTNS